MALFNVPTTPPVLAGNTGPSATPDLNFRSGSRSAFSILSERPSLAYVNLIEAFLAPTTRHRRGTRLASLGASMRGLVLVISLNREPCSTDTGMYCRAKAKLPVALLSRLPLEAADQRR